MTAEKTFKISYEQCKEHINGVCSRCGGELKPIETVDNAGDPTHWSCCESCDVFDWGVSKRVYNIAKYLVDERNHIEYSHMRQPNDTDGDWYKEYYRQSQISGTCTIVMSVLYADKKLETI
jgi:hypothetical protein